MLLDTATAELVGINTEYGPEQTRRGSFWGAMEPLTWNVELDCGVGDEHLVGYVSGRPRAELRSYRGEPIVLFWYRQDDGEVVRDVGRDTIVEFLNAGLVEEMNIAFAPVVFGEGIPLFGGIDRTKIALEIVGARASKHATHLEYRVSRR